MVIQVYTPTSNPEEAEVERFYEDLQDLLELTPPKDVLFIIEDWNEKARSHKIPGVTGKFSLGVQNEAESESEIVQSCPTLCHPMDDNLPGSAVHGIFQARILEWAAISFSRGSSQPRDRTWVSNQFCRQYYTSS